MPPGTMIVFLTPVCIGHQRWTPHGYPYYPDFTDFVDEILKMHIELIFMKEGIDMIHFITPYKKIFKDNLYDRLLAWQARALKME